MNYYHMLSREEKQKLIATYIDDIEVKIENGKLKIEKINVRKSFYADLLEYHNKYEVPIDINLFVDEYKDPIPTSFKGFKTRKQAKEYFNKLKELYDVNYYEIIPNDNFDNMYFDSNNDIEKIIRIIPIQDNKFNKDKLEFGVITVNLSNILNEKGEQIYKGIIN